MKRLYLVITLACLILACGLRIHSQTTAGIMPYIQMQFFDNNGAPLVGGKVYSYSAGTTTPLNTYTDSGGGTPNANPVILDSAGRASIWLGASGYKFVIKTSADVTVRTIDGVTAPTLSTSSITIPNGQSFTMAAGSTSSFATNLVPSGTRTIGTSGAHWGSGWIDALTIGGGLVFGANNSYDVGSTTAAARSAYAFTAYNNITKMCGTAAGLISSSNCYTWTPTVNGSTNSYIVLTDETGAELLRVSQKESSVTTNDITVSADILVHTDNTFSLGAAVKRLKDIYAAGTVILDGTVAIGGSSNTGTFFLPRYSAVSLAGITVGPSSGGLTVWCNTCAIGSPCAAGSPAGALAIYNAVLTQWDCK